MTLTADRITDLAVRHQVYLEGVKSYMFIEVQNSLDKLETDLFKLLSKAKYRDLPAMTQRQLNALIAELNMVQGAVFGTTARLLERRLREFVEVDRVVQLKAWGTEVNKEADAPINEYDADGYLDEDSAALALIIFGSGIGVTESYYGPAALAAAALMWARVKNSTNPGTGQKLAQLIAGFSAGSAASVERLVRQAHANGLSNDDLITLLLGSARPGLIGGISSQNLIDRIRQQAVAVTDTLFQHVSQQTQAAVVSTIARRYVWNAILDSRTTEICRSRNKKTYTFGKGPLPPAHIRCRSTIAPIVNGVEGRSYPGFSAWLDAQPESVRNDIGRNFDGSSGRMQYSALTLAEFRYKLTLITA
jgi:SPP1 gp7 family putative phage head morphogenesis protein